METKNKITPEIIERLEWYDMGDGIEFELWIDTKTEILYRVPIEIVRDFDNAMYIQWAKGYRKTNR
jgi:hypothetical protein